MLSPSNSAPARPAVLLRNNYMPAEKRPSQNANIFPSLLLYLTSCAEQDFPQLLSLVISETRARLVLES